MITLQHKWNTYQYGDNPRGWYAQVDVDRDHWYNLRVAEVKDGYEWYVDYVDRSIGKPYNSYRIQESLDGGPSRSVPYTGIDPVVTNVAKGVAPGLEKAKFYAETSIGEPRKS